MDGGASDNVPFFDAKTTITVSPFYGEYDICPKVKSTNFLHVDLTKLSLRLCSENVYLLIRALFPPDLKVSWWLCLVGVQLFFASLFAIISPNCSFHKRKQIPLIEEERREEFLIPAAQGCPTRPTGITWEDLNSPTAQIPHPAGAMI